MRNDMPLNDITGALTPRQVDVIDRVSKGEEHAKIAGTYQLGRAAISQDVRRVVMKMGVKNTAEAVARYSREQAYRDVAAKLLAGRIAEPVGEAEEHMNHVLADLANELTTMADALRPA